MKPVILFLVIVCLACIALAEDKPNCDAATEKKLEAEIEKVVGKKAWTRFVKEIDTAGENEKKLHEAWEKFMKRIPKGQAEKVNELDEKYNCHH